MAGAAIVGLIWLLVGTSGGSETPAGDDSGFTPAVADRLTAARVLAEAAARDDNQYKALSDALAKAQTSIARNMRFDEEAIGQLNEARTQCGRL